MKVTAIKQQVKQASRYSVFIDGKFAFGLSETGLIASGLRLNQELGQQELRDIKDTAKTDKAYNQVLGLIARRPRSEWEVQDYLKRKKHDPDFIEQVVERLKERNFINDAAFAEAWASSRRLLRLTSKRRLTQELRQKRVNDEIIGEVLAIDATDEVVVLQELIAKKRKQTKYQDDLKLMQYLSRQGFSYDLIKQAITQP